MLKVVEDQDALPGTYVFEHLCLGIILAGERGAHRTCDGRRQPVVQPLHRLFTHIDEGNKPRSIGKVRHRLPGGCQGQSRLANPTRADQGQQPVVGIIELLGDLIQLGFPSDKASELCRQVVGRHLAGAQIPIADLFAECFRLCLRFHS